MYFADTALPSRRQRPARRPQLAPYPQRVDATEAFSAFLDALHADNLDRARPILGGLNARGYFIEPVPGTGGLRMIRRSN